MTNGVSAVSGQQLTPEQMQMSWYQAMSSIGQADPLKMMVAPGVTDSLLTDFNPIQFDQCRAMGQLPGVSGGFASAFGAFGMGMPGLGMGLGAGYGSLFQYLNMPDASDYVVYERDENGEKKKDRFGNPIVKGTDHKAIRRDLSIIGGVSDAAEVLAQNIENGETSLILNSFKEFEDAVKETKAYQEAEDDKARARVVKEAFKSATGKTLESVINASSNSNFVSGFENGITFGLANDSSNTEIIKELTGREEPRSAKIQRTAGEGAGAGVVVGAVAGVGCAIAGAKIGALGGAWLGPVGAAVGGLAGAAIGGIIGLFR